jgi:DNA-binding transcriptional regulator YbjK
MSKEENKLMQPLISLEKILDSNNQQYANIMSFVDQDTKGMLSKTRDSLLAIQESEKQLADRYFNDIAMAQNKRMAEEQALAQSQSGRS